MFASPFFDPARDWREIAIWAHELLCQIAPDELIDELTAPQPVPEDLRLVA